MFKVVKLIRPLYVDAIIIIDNYDSYYIYGRDVYIVYYLLKLSIKGTGKFKFIKNNIDYLNYLIAKLKEYQINYVVLVKRWGYNVDVEGIFNCNNYNKFYIKGKLVYKRSKDVMQIRNMLRVNILDNKDKIEKIKRLIDSYA